MKDNLAFAEVIRDQLKAGDNNTVELARRCSGEMLAEFAASSAGNPHSKFGGNFRQTFPKG